MFETHIREFYKESIAKQNFCISHWGTCFFFKDVFFISLHKVQSKYLLVFTKSLAGFKERSF